MPTTEIIENNNYKTATTLEKCPVPVSCKIQRIAKFGALAAVHMHALH